MKLNGFLPLFTDLFVRVPRKLKSPAKMFIVVCSLTIIPVFFLPPPSFSSSESVIDYGDLKSETLIQKSWKALSEGRYEEVYAYTDKCITLYSLDAKKINQQADQDATYCQNIKNCEILNDVTMAYFIRGEAYLKTRHYLKAKEAFEILLKDYSHGQNWDPQGWYWNVQEVAKEKLRYIDDKLNGRDPRSTETGDVLRLQFLSNGCILADGAKVDWAQLKRLLKKLKKKKGEVWYYRENSDRELTKSESRVFDLMSKYALPKSVSSKPDFSDYEEDGEFFPRSL